MWPSTETGKLCWVIDAPVSFSRDLGRDLERRMEDRGVSGETMLTPSADRSVVAADGLAATADSGIVDKKGEVLDLARHSLERRFTPEFFALSSFFSS